MDQNDFTRFIRNSILTTTNASCSENKKSQIKITRARSILSFKDGIDLEKFLYFMFTSPQKCYEMLDSA